MILDRINLLKGKKKIESLEDLVKGVSDPEIKKKLQGEISELKADSEKARLQRDELEKIQRQQESEENKKN